MTVAQRGDIKSNTEERELRYTPFASDTEIKLTVAIVTNLICIPTRNGHRCSPQDAIKFMMMCQARKLNPFEGDAFLQGYDSSNGPTFNLITAHQAFLKRAEVNKEYDGMESGVMVLGENGAIDELQGDFVPSGRTLVGGWAKVHLKHRKIPMYRRLDLKVFCKVNREGKPYGRWQDDPAGMVVKCFDEHTEILTTRGFERFAKAEGSILQVTSRGLEPTDAVPFYQPYTGPMVEFRSRNGNFCVTPNHDLPLAINGEREMPVEARHLLDARQRDDVIMPLTAAFDRADYPIEDQWIQLAAAYVADGSDNSRSSGSRTAELDWLVGRGKTVSIESLLALSPRQAKLFVDTWLAHDGHRSKSLLIGRLYNSRPDLCSAFEIAATIAGYSVSERGANYSLTVTSRASINLACDTIRQIPNPGQGVWCVKVPTGKIVVRRRGFSAICHQCAEADALRSAFPTMLGNLYLEQELNPDTEKNVTPVPKIEAPSFITQAPEPTQLPPIAPGTPPEAEPEPPDTPVTPVGDVAPDVTAHLDTSKDPAAVINFVKDLMKGSGVSDDQVTAHLRATKLAKSNQQWMDVSDSKLRTLANAWFIELPAIKAIHI